MHCQRLNLVTVLILKYYVSRELEEIGRKMIYLEDNKVVILISDFTFH